MVVLVFDQSTRASGYAVFEDGKYVDSGLVDMNKSKLNTDERSFEMAKALWKVIKQYKPSHLVLEETQQQSNVKTVIILSRLQGMIIGYAEAHKVKTHIVQPSRWRAALQFAQGPKVKRAELKQQSLDHVKEYLGLDLPEDQAEACCIGFAAHKIFDFE
jgi:Holliday junction resolvasome RuvABC endonuclease subunit